MRNALRWPSASPAAVQAFIASPGSLLQQLRNDKEKLAGRLTGYLVTDPTPLPSVAKLVNESSDRDRVAIGAGLYRAEFRCLPTKPEASRKISDFVRKLGDRAVVIGYAAESEQLGGTAPSQAGKPANTSSGLLTENGTPTLPIRLPMCRFRSANPDTIEFCRCINQETSSRRSRNTASRSAPPH